MKKIKPLLYLPVMLYLLNPGTTLAANEMLEDMKGHKIAFSELKGKWVFINYWASWCRPCLAEIPELNRFYEENKQDHVAVFAVNYDAVSLAKQEQLIKAFHINYPSLKKDPASELTLGDIRGVPVTFVFDPQGQLYDALYGQQTSASLHQIIHKSSDDGLF